MSIRLKSVVNHCPEFLSHGIPLDVAEEVFEAVRGHILLHPVLVSKPLQQVSTRYTRIQDHFNDLIHGFVLDNGGSLINKIPDLGLFIGATDDLNKIMCNYVLDPGLEEDIHLLS